MIESEFSYRVKHNSQGFRDKERLSEKGRPRILILGDSHAWGYGAQQDEIFTSIAEDKLSSVEVINAGVTGYGTFQELLLLKEIHERYNPDIVVVAFLSNDIFGNLSHSRMMLGAKRYRPPGFDLKWLLRFNSVAYNILAEYSMSAPRLRIFLERAGIAKHRDSHAQLKYLEDGWPLTKRLLREIVDFNNARNSQTLIAIIPDREYILTKAGIPTGRPFDIVPFCDKVFTSLEDFCHENNICFINPGETLVDLTRKGKKLYLYEGHFTKEGHRVFAEVLVEYLRSKYNL